MDVGWWVSFDNCDLHHPLRHTWSCEVLIGDSGVWKCGVQSLESVGPSLECSLECEVCQTRTPDRRLRTPDALDSRLRFPD